MIDDTPIQEQPIQETEVQEEQAEQQEQPAVEQPKPQPRQETEAQRNFKALREERERLARERDDALRRLKELEAHQSDNEVAMGDDDIVEGKHYKALRQQQKQLHEEIQKQKQYLEEVSVEAKIKSQYPDFDAVFNRENIEKLRDMHPEIAATLATGDKYSAAVSAYKIMKQFNIAESDPYMADKEKAQQNAYKPRPTATLNPQTGGSPMEKANAFANGLTEELKAQLRKEMLEAMKNR